MAVLLVIAACKMKYSYYSNSFHTLGIKSHPDHITACGQIMRYGVQIIIARKSLSLYFPTNAWLYFFATSPKQGITSAGYNQVTLYMLFQCSESSDPR